MRKNIYQKYKAAMCFIIALQLAGTCIAGDLEDTINQIAGNANVVDVASSNEGDIAKQAIEIKPQNENDIDTQLKQIEENYKSQIDSCTNQQNHDALSSNLSGLNGINNKGLKTHDIKDLTDKNAPNRKKIKISKNDELLIAAQSIDKATIDEATNTVILPEVSTKHTKGVEDRILTCHEAGDEVVKKCYRSRIVKAKQPENINFIVEVYFSAQSYAGHYTSVDLKTGAISYHNSNANHPSSKVVNSFSTYAPNAEIISIRHIESRWWHEAGVHTESAHSQITQPSKENDYVYKNSIEQGAMGRKKMKRRNGDKYRGRVEKWEVTAKPAPVLEEHWDNGECDQLANYAQESFCEGPVINLIAVGETRTIENYPHPVTRPYWQEEHIYACGGGSIANGCLTLHNAGCTQIDSKCISTKGPFCVEYLQTFNCGKNRIISNLTTRGNKVSINGADNEGANDGFEIEEFGNAIGQLSMVEELKRNIVRSGDGTVLLFKGDRLTCDKDFGSDIKNCCNLKGVFKNIIGHKCPKEVEEILAPAVVRERRCHEVAGWECVARYPGIKKCRKWRKSFCCYQSRLARIFQQIAHHQLGISWGSAESPNCGPLDPHTFGRLNFDDPYAKSLLKEVIDEVNVNAQQYANRANAKLANNEDLSNKVKQLQERVGAYYETKTQSTEG